MQRTKTKKKPESRVEKLEDQSSVLTRHSDTKLSERRKAEQSFARGRRSNMKLEQLLKEEGCASLSEYLKKRTELKRQGLRPVQMWVPDTSNPKFRAECRRQSRLLARDPHEKEILDWIEKAAEGNAWGEWKG